MNCEKYQNNDRRHAYLFLVCKDTYVLEKALQLIDDERNDIYIHVDKKSKNWDFQKYKNIVKKSNLYFTQRINCNWAAYSLLNATVILCKAAYKHHYKYYHLMSESDLPIKSQDYIHDQLNDSNFDYVEMIGIGNESWANDDWNTYIWNKYYYFFTETPLYRKSKIVKGISRILLIAPQRVLKIDRWKNTKNIYNEKVIPSWGWQWFSLTDKTVGLIVSKENFIKKHFSKSHASDECCIPTILKNFTDMKNVRPSRRNIIFDGKPSVLTIDDYERLITSDDFFARKFDENTDKEVINKIYNKIAGEKYDK